MNNIRNIYREIGFLTHNIGNHTFTYARASFRATRYFLCAKEYYYFENNNIETKSLNLVENFARRGFEYFPETFAHNFIQKGHEIILSNSQEGNNQEIINKMRDVFFRAGRDRGRERGCGDYILYCQEIEIISEPDKFLKKNIALAINLQDYLKTIPGYANTNNLNPLHSVLISLKIDKEDHAFMISKIDSNTVEISFDTWRSYGSFISLFNHDYHVNLMELQQAEFGTSCVDYPSCVLLGFREIIHGLRLKLAGNVNLQMRIPKQLDREEITFLLAELGWQKIRETGVEVYYNFRMDHIINSQTPLVKSIRDSHLHIVLDVEGAGYSRTKRSK